MLDTQDLIRQTAPSLLGAKGVVALLGYSPGALQLLSVNPDVRKVFVVTDRFMTLPLTGRGPDFLELVEANPFRLLRRDLGHVQVDFMFVDLWNDPWAIGRTDIMRDLAREFRPRRIGYRWQELDIAANWVSAGKALGDMTDVLAIDIFRAEFSLMVEPRTEEYVTFCRDMALEKMAEARAARR